MRQPERFAVLSTALPPSWSGQSVALLRLLEGVDPGRFCLIGPREDLDSGRDGRYLPELPAVRHALPSTWQWTRGSRFGLHRVREAANHLVRIAGVLPRAWRIASILRRERCDAVVACTGDLQDPPAAWLAARWTGARFFLHAFDDWSRQMIAPIPRRFAALLERWVLKGAAGVIVPNEYLAEALARRCGVAATVVRNPCRSSDGREGGERVPRAEGSEPTADPRAACGAREAGAGPGPAAPPSRPRIVYTGAIYQAQLDAFLDLLLALERCRHREASVHVYTAIPEDALRRMGIAGRVTVHPHQDPLAVAAIQRSADVLFLPLAFESPYGPEIIRTSAPGKTGEYLAAGRPILVHAPAGSFVAWYFRTHRCGLVVDRKDPSALADALDRLLDDQGLRRELAENAWARACADFDAAVARERWLDALARGCAGRCGGDRS